MNWWKPCNQLSGNIPEKEKTLKSQMETSAVLLSRFKAQFWLWTWLTGARLAFALPLFAVHMSEARNPPLDKAGSPLHDRKIRVDVNSSLDSSRSLQEVPSIENQAMLDQLCAMQMQMNSFLLQSASMQSLAYWCWMNYYMLHWPHFSHAQIPVATSQSHPIRTTTAEELCGEARETDSPSPDPNKDPDDFGTTVWSAEDIIQAVGRSSICLPRAPKEMLVYQEDLEKELTTKFFDPLGPSVPGKGQKLSVCPYKLDCRHQHCTKAHMATEITCYFWERGNCFKNTSCPYLHGYVQS